MLTLYHHGSSACAAKVPFAVAEIRLQWTSSYVDIMKGEQFPPEFIALNPKAVVPVLVDDGCVIAQRGQSVSESGRTPMAGAV